MSIDAGLFTKRVARATDPVTSHMNRSEKTLANAIGLLWPLFEEGDAWTDEAIEESFRKMHSVITPQRLRMARLALSEAGKIRCVGTRKTKSGGTARVWVMA